MPPPARLITIGVSHYCEKARWALERHGVPFREERHPPAWHILAVKRHGGGRTVPVLITPEGAVLDDSTEILQWLDAQQAEPARRLYPEEHEARAEVEALEDLFDERLGPHTRRLAYLHALDDPMLVPTVTAGVGRLERALFRATRPAVVALMRRAMRIDAAGAERSRGKLEEVLQGAEERLSEGARYLVGDRFTAADLTFAALYGPLVMPPEYGFEGLPALEELPPPMRALVDEARARPAGAFALRLYREERRATVVAG